MKHSLIKFTYISWALRLAGIGWILWDAPFIVMVLPTDFEYYYKAAVRLLAGENIYYDWMAESVREGIGSWYLYPPYFAGALTPLTWLGHPNAKLLFTVLTVGSLIGVDLLLTHFRKRCFPELKGVDLLIHCLVFFSIPTRLVLGSLQVEGTIFFLFLLALRFLLDGRNDWTISCAFLPGVSIKLWPGPFCLTLLLALKKRFLLIIGLTALLVVALFTVIFGWRPQWDYLHSIFPTLASYADPYKDNQSLSIFIARFIPLGEFLARFLRWGILLSYVWITYNNRFDLGRRNERALLINACLFLAVSLLVTPTAWTAAHLRLLLPMVMACGLCVKETQFRKTLLALTFLSVLFYAFPQELGKKVLPVWLDRYPVLWAAILQYLVYLRLSIQPRSADILSAKSFKYFFI